MMNQNIEFYNRNATWYTNDIVGLDISEQLKRFLELIPSNGRILDGWCVTGRDSLTQAARIPPLQRFYRKWRDELPTCPHICAGILYNICILKHFIFVLVD